MKRTILVYLFLFKIEKNNFTKIKSQKTRSYNNLQNNPYKKQYNTNSRTIILNNIERNIVKKERWINKEIRMCSTRCDDAINGSLSNNSNIPINERQIIKIEKTNADNTVVVSTHIQDTDSSCHMIHTFQNKSMTSPSLTMTESPSLSKSSFNNKNLGENQINKSSNDKTMREIKQLQALFYRSYEPKNENIKSLPKVQLYSKRFEISKCLSKKDYMEMNKNYTKDELSEIGLLVFNFYETITEDIEKEISNIEEKHLLNFLQFKNITNEIESILCENYYKNFYENFQNAVLYLNDIKWMILTDEKILDMHLGEIFHLHNIIYDCNYNLVKNFDVFKKSMINLSLINYLCRYLREGNETTVLQNNRIIKKQIRHCFLRILKKSVLYNNSAKQINFCNKYNTFIELANKTDVKFEFFCGALVFGLDLYTLNDENNKMKCLINILYSKLKSSTMGKEDAYDFLEKECGIHAVTRELLVFFKNYYYANDLSKDNVYKKILAKIEEIKAIFVENKQNNKRLPNGKLFEKYSDILSSVKSI